MEAIGAFLLLILLYAVANAILTAGARTVKAASKTAMGKGSLSDNMSREFQGMGPLEVMVEAESLGDGADRLIPTMVKVRGIFPLARPRKVGFVVSLFDQTDGELEPMISFLEEFQEPHSVVYQSRSTMGVVGPSQGFASWVRVGAIFPPMLQPPVGGVRELLVAVRLVDIDTPVWIHNGYAAPDDPSLIWTAEDTFQFEFDGKGYRELAEERDEAGEVTVKLAMAVAMADGALADEEGRVIRDWVKRAISPFGEERKTQLKDRYNGALRDSYQDAIGEGLAISGLVERLARLQDTAMKYEAVELCFDVMAADGEADASEMTLIRQIASKLELDLDEVHAMRDQRILNLNAEGEVRTEGAELLGLDPSWEPETAKAHLRSEFQKWNNRLTSLPEGPERENAQRMIDTIAALRRQYD